MGLTAINSLELTLSQAVAIFALANRDTIGMNELKLIVDRSQAATSKLVEGLEPEPDPAAPQRVPALIPQDLKEPRRERPLQVEAGQRFPCLHERVLQRVPRIVRVPHHSQSHPQSGALVRPHDRFEEASVARLALSQ